MAIENEEINETRVINYNSEDLICNEFSELFLKQIGDHEWNHIIYAEIINFLKPKNLNIIKVKNNKIIKTKKIAKKNNMLELRKLIDFLMSKTWKNDKIIFYKTYIEKKNLIKLCLNLKQFPRMYGELNRKLNFTSILDREKFKLNISASNNFEIFFERMLIKILPYSYLENYKEIKNEVKKIKLNPKIICTATGHTLEDFFKIWSAEKTLIGTKYIVTDHGGYMDDNQNFNSWERFSDYYLRWNFKKEKNIKQMPPGILFKRYDILKKHNYNKILMISGTANCYPNKIQSPSISGQIINMVKLWNNFYAKLDEDKKKFFKFRPHTADFWNIKNFFSERHGTSILSSEKKFKNDIKNSKIIINTSFSTPFFETMSSGRPTIVLLNESFFSISDEKRELINEFYNNQILFDNADSAVQHLNKIWESPDEWWSSKEILKTREKFHNLCFIKKKNEIKFWSNFFTSQINI